MKSCSLQGFLAAIIVGASNAWVPTHKTSSAHRSTKSEKAFASIISLPRTSLFNTGSDSGTVMGLNELQTLLRDAVKNEDFDEAIRLRDILAERVSSGAYSPQGDGESDKRKMQRLSWRGLGTAPWLEDRLDALSYKFPTTIQINAFESVNTMLGALDGDSNFVDKETLEELMYRKGKPGMNMGVVVSGSTGSGKTLSYLVPMLSTLSESLFTRQRIRVKSEEDIGDVADDLLARIAVQTSPTVRGHGRQQVGGKGTIATGAALSSMGKSGTDVKNPLALIVVPSRELGVQIALLLYELVGGSTKKTETELPGIKNFFKYKGPKGVKIGCILDEEEVKYGLKLQTDVAITTPEHLPKLIRDGDVVPSKLRVIIYDEADLALDQTPDEDLNLLFRDTEFDRDFSRLTYLVGASVTESLGKLCVRDSVLPEGNSFIASATRFAPIVSEDVDSASNDVQQAKVSLKDLGMCLDPGLRHERMIAPEKTGLLCLSRMLRKELKIYENDIALGKNETMKIQRPKVVVFFPGEEEARAAIVPMRDAMWGDHKLCVLLPKSGVNPLTIMEQFKNSQTSIMLATPNSVRGLDFADLTHVYTLYLPSDDPREYLHLAGRVGRIGQMGSVAGTGGRVTSILRPDEAAQMVDLAKELNFEFTDIDYEAGDAESTDVEYMRRYLEDKITLLDLSEDPELDFDELEKNRPVIEYDEEENDNEDGN
eukprot:scaffold10194_cov279-Chaetoceros_neogracile.AAC.8